MSALPPNSPESERAAIGCALQDPTLAGELKPEMFFDLRYKTVAEAILRFASEGRPIAPDTVAQHLLGKLEDAVAVVMACSDACHSPANWPYWRDELAEHFLRREVIKAAHKATQEALDLERPASEVLGGFESEALGIRQAIGGRGADEVDKRKTLLDLVGEYEDARDRQRPVGIQTGFVDLDRIIGGLKGQQLVVIAARPAVGKTALALNIAEHVAVVENIPVGFWSLEMSGGELLHRMSCSNGRVDAMRLRDGKADDADVRKLVLARDKIVKAPLHISDRGGLSIAQLLASARRMQQRHGIKLAVVDYLGLLRSGERGRSRYEETTLVSNGLKLLAKELNIPLVALAQLNRESDKENRPPRLSDLRDSGAIEQDADIAMTLHREAQDDADANQGAQLVRVTVSKQRNGRTGSFTLAYIGKYTRFESAA